MKKILVIISIVLSINLEPIKQEIKIMHLRDSIFFQRFLRTRSFDLYIEMQNLIYIDCDYIAPLSVMRVEKNIHRCNRCGVMTKKSIMCERCQIRVKGKGIHTVECALCARIVELKPVKLNLDGKKTFSYCDKCKPKEEPYALLRHECIFHLDSGQALIKLERVSIDNPMAGRTSYSTCRQCKDKIKRRPALEQLQIISDQILAEIDQKNHEQIETAI